MNLIGGGTARATRRIVITSYSIHYTKLYDANGFLVAALRGLVRTVFSDYPRLRAALGFTLYDEAAMVEKLKLAGFAANRAPRNLGHNQARMTFMAQPH